MVRTVSSGCGRKRASRAKEPTKMGNPSDQSNYNQSIGPPPCEPLEPLQMSKKDLWKRPTQNVEPDSPELVDRKVRALLNKLTMEKFDSISNQLIQWENKSEKEKDGRTLIQVIRLVFEKATDEARWSEMYARLCRTLMEQISPNVQDDGIRNADGNPIAGGLLFRKYLLNRCQEDFERGWKAKESTAAAAATKATDDQAAKEAAEKDGPKEGGGEVLYSTEYYAAQKAKRQGLGLVKFIGELFKLQMLTERIMHECIKKLLSNVDNPEEEEIESLCKLLSTVGQALDTTKARGHMDVYFSRMKELATSNHVSSRMQFMLQDAIELRERKWIPRNLAAAPTTIAQVHEAAAKEKAQREKDALHGRNAGMSRGGSRRGHERGEFAQTGPDGWAVAGGSGPPRPPAKAGDLTNFGKITKAAAGSMRFGPSSVFTKKDGKGGREPAALSRTSSSQNMFSIRPPSHKPSVDLSQSMTADGSPQTRPKLNLLPRTKPNVNDANTDETPDASETGSEDEGGKDAVPAMSEEEAMRQIGQDIKEFFAIHNMEETEAYWTKLPVEHRFRLVDELVTFAIQSKEADAKLVAEFFDLAVKKDLCPPASFEDGFLPTIEILDDIAIDAPMAFDLMTTMLDGSKLDTVRRKRLAGKPVDGDRLLASRRGNERGQFVENKTDGWTTASGSNSQRPLAKAYDITSFGINRNPTSITSGQSSMFTKNDGIDGRVTLAVSDAWQTFQTRLIVARAFNNDGLDEVENYWTSVSKGHHHIVVHELVTSALSHSDALIPNAKCVASLFRRLVITNAGNRESILKGFTQTIDLLDELIVEMPNAMELVAIMLNGAKLSDKQLAVLVQNFAHADVLRKVVSAISFLV
ncbi:ARM repeat-containing protein [Rickenella mellea]|uniref:ARM repeat-containing protein n=1 Tax=Rickenella mellea TaxID=50990 RepID=A0A4Y7Q709_9AGAM|nr:ARM repeat-containing protein [Rickenella mellea]